MIQKETLLFLKDLKKNNDRAWFDKNRSRYRESVENIQEFAGDLINTLKIHNKHLSTLTYKECLFRIFRDVRFSPNKDPYKSHFGIVVSEGGRKSPLAGFYIQIDATSSFLAAGCWMPQGPILKNIRQEIDYNYKDFLKIIKGKKFEDTFGELVDERLKTSPKGYDTDNPAIEYLRLTSVMVTRNVTQSILTSKGLIKECENSYKTALPLINFLNEAIR